MRWIGRLLLTFVTLAALLVLSLFFVPSQKIASIAAEKFEDATGRGLTIRGDIRPTIYPRLGVRIHRVDVANAPWAGKDPLISAETLSVGVALGPLMNGEIQVQEMRLVRPDIRLLRDADGRSNWDFSQPSAEPDTSAPSGATQDTATMRVSIDLAEISDGRLTFRDLGAAQTFALEGMDATLRLPDPDGALDVTASARMNGQKLTTDGQIDHFTAFLAGDVRDITLTATIGGSTVDFDGRAGLAPIAADGALKARLKDMAALFNALGSTPPAIPKGLGQEVNLEGALTVAPEGSVHLRAMELELDQNYLSGDADIYFEKKPKIRARLSGDTIDLAALGLSSAGGETTRSGAAQNTTGWPSTAIDASGLGALDGEVALRLGGVDLGAAQLGGVDLVMRLNRARAVFELRQVAAYGGNITGEFVLNNRSGLSVGGDLRFADIALQPLLQGFADYDRLVGQGTLAIKFLGVGQSIDAIMHSLKGTGSLSVGKGELLGLDLGGMLRNLDASYRGAGQKTIFDRIQSTFTIADGVLQNSDLDFVAPVLRASGRGEVGLGDQTLSYRVTPVALQSSDGTGGIRVPVLISGTWANPKFRPDLESLIDEKLEEEKARLEAKARAQLETQRKRLEEEARAKAAEELGLSPEEVENTQDLEDAVRKKAEDELKKLLGFD